MEIRRCMHCMHSLKPEETVCPVCGRTYGEWKTEPFALKPGAILEGKYLVGEMLGQGGFGITYLGFDLLLEQKVAIKEYFPMSTGMVSRENKSTVVWSSAMMEKSGFQKGFDSFLKEARKMAKLGGIPGVVGVKSVFIQNETAYIVMNFIEGETLLKKLEREGPMEYDTCVSLLTPIMQALAVVHQHGIIHRDISPDNIMVQPDGNLVLLDMGAAKELDIQGDNGSVQSSQLVAKHGFSPFEQYGRSEEIGPWTDVYAMAATIYYCCTGKLPPSAVDRVVRDTLSCQPLLTQAQFNALTSCMTILAEKRPQDMNAMLRIVEKPSKIVPQKPEPPNPEPPKTGGTVPKWLFPALAGIVILCIVLAIGGGNKPDKPSISAGAAPITAVPAETAPKGTIPYQTVPEFDSPIASEPENTASVTEGPTLPSETPEARTFICVDGGRDYTVVLYSDGTVEAIGSNNYGQCDVDEWTDIIQISTLIDHTVGLKSDGTVVATGLNTDGQCNVSDWTDIIAVSAGQHHTVGVRSDGTVLSVGKNQYGECEVQNWQDIVDVGASMTNTFGLCSDGTVIVSGSMRKGKIPDWERIQSISVSDSHIVGLRTDGRVKAAGNNNHNQCDLSDWSDIVAIATGCAYSIGVRSNGTVLVEGVNDVGQHLSRQWTGITYIGTGLEHTIGLKSDGTLVAVGANYSKQCNVSEFSQ